MMDNNPKLRLFQLSPAQQAVELAARAFPIFRPEPKFTDTAPLVTPILPRVEPPEPGPAWPMWLVSLGMLLIPGLIITLRANTRKERVASGSRDAAPTNA